MYTDHTTVQVVLETPNRSGKHARWWSHVYGKGVKEVKIVRRSGKMNLNVDTLSQSPVGPAPVEGPGWNEVQVSAVSSDENIESLLDSKPPEIVPDSFSNEQKKDEQLREIIQFLEMGELPSDDTRACKIALQQSLFVMVDVLMFVDMKHKGQRQVVVPEHLRQRMMEEPCWSPLLRE